MVKRFILIFILLVGVAGVANAEIYLESLENEKYNVGDIVVLKGYAQEQENFGGDLEIKSFCGNESKVILFSVLDLDPGEKHQFSQEFAANKEIIGGCYFTVSLKGEGISEEKRSVDFTVTRELRVDGDIDVITQKPGSDVIVSGVIRKVDGLRVESGSVAFTLNGKVYGSGLSNGAFSYRITLPADIGSGEQIIIIKARDLAGNDGDGEVRFRVISVPEDLTISTDKDTYLPGESITATILLIDQSGKNVVGSSTIQLVDPEGNDALTKVADNGDEFEIGEKISGEIRIKNNLEDDYKFDVSVYLYDVNEENSISKISEKIKIDEGDSENYEFEIEIPMDIEDEEFVIYAYVETSDEICNSAYNEIEIQRKDHDVQIDNIEINPVIVSPGDESEVSVKIKNLGTEDEDIKIKIEVLGMNLSKTSEEFEIEEFGQDDKETKKMILAIPEDAKEGEYSLKATVFFEDGESYATEDFAVLKGESSENNVVENILIKIGDLNGIIKLSDSTASGNVIKIEKSKVSKAKDSKSTGAVLSIKAGEVLEREKTSAAGISFEEKAKESKNPLRNIALILGIGIAVLILIIIILFLFF